MQTTEGLDFQPNITSTEENYFPTTSFPVNDMDKNNETKIVENIIPILANKNNATEKSTENETIDESSTARLVPSTSTEWKKLITVTEKIEPSVNISTQQMITINPTIKMSTTQKIGILSSRTTERVIIKTPDDIIIPIIVANSSNSGTKKHEIVTDRVPTIFYDNTQIDKYEQMEDSRKSNIKKKDSAPMHSNVEHIVPLPAYKWNEDGHNQQSKLAHVSMIGAIILSIVGFVSLIGGFGMYYWRRNKGIARARAYDADGRNLSAHDANDDFLWLERGDSRL